MPIYEFKCEACGDVFEVLCRERDDAKAVCPACGSEDCRRLISRVAATRSKDVACDACDISVG